MKYLVINEVAGSGSTGKIVADICRKYQAEGNECVLVYGRSDAVNCDDIKLYRIGNSFDVKLHALQTRIFDNAGFCSKRATKKFLQWAENFNPDVVWLHNLHGYYINIELLFEWMKAHPEKTYKWTLHDCWAFTGHCVYFSYAGCNQWQVKCRDCPQLKTYPKTLLFGNVEKNFDRKKTAFTNVKNMTLITPSKWLSELVKQSFLKEYPIEVVYNTIDKNIFKPTPSDFRERYGLENKKIILGVASPWSERKGLGDFLKLAEMLDEKYTIVLVGLSNKQIRDIKKKYQNVVALQKTHNREELAKIYTASDVYVNPSKEETFGMTTAEAALCGTKSIVYKGTAGEEVVEQYGGCVVEQGVESINKFILSSINMYGGGGRATIIALPRTNNGKELAAIYTTADVFLNLTYEDNYPTTNLEAQACGTRCITYRTGGSVESVRFEDIVNLGDFKSLVSIL